MSDIVINEKFRTLIPPLNKAEYTELEKSLIKEGCREPLITWNGYSKKYPRRNCCVFGGTSHQHRH